MTLNKMQEFSSGEAVQVTDCFHSLCRTCGIMCMSSVMHTCTRLNIPAQQMVGPSCEQVMCCATGIWAKAHECVRFSTRRSGPSALPRLTMSSQKEDWKSDSLSFCWTRCTTFRLFKPFFSHLFFTYRLRHRIYNKKWRWMVQMAFKLLRWSYLISD